MTLHRLERSAPTRSKLFLLLQLAPGTRLLHRARSHPQSCNLFEPHRETVAGKLSGSMMALRMQAPSDTRSLNRNGAWDRGRRLATAGAGWLLALWPCARHSDRACCCLVLEEG